MTQYIDKAEVVAEIESLRRTTWTNFDEGVNATVQTLLEVVNTLEVKEVDKESSLKFTENMDEKIRQYLLWLVKPLWEDAIDNVGLKKDDIIAWIENKGE